MAKKKKRKAAEQQFAAGVDVPRAKGKKGRKNALEADAETIVQE